MGSCGLKVAKCCNENSRYKPDRFPIVSPEPGILEAIDEDGTVWTVENRSGSVSSVADIPIAKRLAAIVVAATVDLFTSTR